MSNQTNMRRIRPALLIAALSLISVILVARVDTYPHRHDLIVQQIAESPYQYRVLMPYIASWLSGVMPVMLAYLLVHVAMLPLFYGGLYVWAEDNNADGTTMMLIGFVLFILTINTVYNVMQVWAVVEVICLCIGLYYAKRQRLLITGVIALLAVLNRETGLLFGGALLLMYPRNRRVWTLVVMQVAIVLMLRVVLHADSVYPISEAWQRAWVIFRHDTIVNNAVLIPLWLWFLVGYTRAQFRRLLILAGAYAVVVVTLTQPNEVRLWLSLLPLLTPFAVSVETRKT